MLNDAAAQLSLALEANDVPYGELAEAARAFMQPLRRMQINRNWGWAKLQPLLRKKFGPNYAAELSSGEVQVD